MRGVISAVEETASRSVMQEDDSSSDREDPLRSSIAYPGSSDLRVSVRFSIYSIAFCNVFTLDRRLFRFSKGTHFRNWTKAELTA